MDEFYRGMVFFIQHREVTSSKAHYLVLMNDKDSEADIIVFGVVTSGVEKAEKRVLINKEMPTTLVKISPKDYPELKHDSVVDCNSPVKYSRDEFEKTFGEINAKRKCDMPAYICEAIVRGIKDSRQVSIKIKNSLVKKA